MILHKYVKYINVQWNMITHFSLYCRYIIDAPSFFFFSTGFSKSWSLYRRSETWHPIWLGGVTRWSWWNPEDLPVDRWWFVLPSLKGCQIAHMKTQSLGKFSVALTGRLWESFFFWTVRHFLDFFGLYVFFWCILAWEPPTFRRGSQPKLRFIIECSPASGAASRIGDHMPGVLLCTKGEVRGQGAEQQWIKRRGVLIDASVVDASDEMWFLRA